MYFSAFKVFLLLVLSSFKQRAQCFLLQVVLDSDDRLFGGFNRLDHNAEYFTSVRSFIRDEIDSLVYMYTLIYKRVINTYKSPQCMKICNQVLQQIFPLQEGWYDDRPRSFLVYAPCRTAVVYGLVEDEPQPV